jgi:hypothetical protein
MRRQRFLLLAVAVLVLAAAVAALIPRKDPSRIAYDKVRAGMTSAEIEAFLGPPLSGRADWPEGFGPGWENEALFEAEPRPAGASCVWAVNGGMVWVSFNDLGQAKRKCWREPEGPLRRLVRLARRCLP